MRSIKFRGRRTDNGQWVYGDLVRASGYTIFTKTYIVLSDEGELEFIEVNPVTVGQYTGLKDKWDVEIYFGDILQTSSDDPETDMWKPSNWGYTVCVESSDELGVSFTEWYPTGEKSSVFYWDYIEVIGNTIDNAELLK